MTEISSLFSKLDSTPRTSGASNTNLANDFNSFLSLLTVQLQNQDPLEPLDTNQFTEQIVNMTQVEQTVSMNDRLGALIEAQETQRIQTAVDFIGKQVDALGDVIPQPENGAEMFYSLEESALSVTADIVEVTASGADKVIASVDAPETEQGVHRLLWDGFGSDGEPVDPEKTYRLKVRANDSAGEAINVKIGYSGIAEELRHDNGELELLVAGERIPLDQIVAARTPTFIQTPGT